MAHAWPFLGREREIAAVGRALAGGANVVLDGAAGVGKSHLAAHALPCATRVRASRA
ncbi:MAG: hypothetical protein HOY71_19810, partial [Nonomuraea sp.]|nr:hypothetical protein [Nonomuraea sp.]